MWAVDLDAAGPGKAGPGRGHLKRPDTQADEGLVTGSPSPRNPRSPADGRPAAGAGERCPRCNARVRPEYAWCALCHLDLRPQPEPTPPPDGAEAAPVTDEAPLTDEAPVTDEAATERAVASAEAMLVELRVSESGSGMPAALAQLGPGGRFMLAGAAGALLALLLVGGTALLGLVL